MIASTRRSISHPLAAVAWVLVVTVVLFYTIGKAHVSVAGLWEPSVHSLRELRLVPFDGFFNPTVWYGPWVNLFGNVALFVPVGLLAGSLRRGAAIGFALSFGIEVTQWVFASGYTDIDDIVFNTAGAAVGGLAAAKVSEFTLHTMIWVITAGAAVLIVPFLAASVA